MQGFYYKYYSSSEIIQNIKLIKDFNIFELILLVLLMVLVVYIINYLIPTFYILRDYLKTEKEKRKRKMMLKKIVLQREIEDSILKETKIKEV